jgi:hypothetical protein
MLRSVCTTLTFAIQPRVLVDTACEGRSHNHPSLGWYKGELWFFRKQLLYCIPLAQKLKDSFLPFRLVVFLSSDQECF